MNKYNVHIFQENDNVNIIFDRYNLVNVLAELYTRIGVIDRMATNLAVSAAEKNIITSVLGDNTNIQCNEADKDKTIETILEVIKMAQTLNSLKSSLKTIQSSNQASINQANNQSMLSTSSFQPLDTLCYVSHGDTNANRPEKEKGVLTPFFNLISKTSIRNTELSGSNEDNGNYTYLINEVKREFDEQESKHSHYILYNTIYEAVIICKADPKIAEVVREFNDFKLIRMYNDMLDTTFKNIDDYFTTNVYCTEEMLIKKLDAFESLYDINRECPLQNEKKLILYYINTNYVVSDNIDKRIKISTLLNEVQKELRVNDSNLKYRFATILADIGLKKKRYSDGMYIYGIETKYSRKLIEIGDKPSFIIESILEDREKELQTIKADLKIKRGVPIQTQA
jgi:hypothetical protein